MECPKCGLFNTDSAIVCDCGYQFRPNPDSDTSPNNTSSKPSITTRPSQSFPNWVYIVGGIIAVYFLYKSGIFHGSSIPFLPVAGLSEYNQGLHYQQTNQDELAEQQYKLAIQKNPDLAEAYLNIGVIYIERTWFDGGEQMTNKCIDILNRTRKTLIKGNTLNQTLSIGYNNLGVVAMGRALQAETKFNYVLARQYWKAGMSHFHKAVELDPMNSQAQASIQNFKDAYSDY